MNCLKCGKQTHEQQVFCPDCLRVMEKYPVAPGATVQLPQRDTAAPKKDPVKPHRTQSEIILRMRSTIRWLWMTVAILLVMLCITALILAHHFYKDAQTQNIGRNYTAVESTTDVSRETSDR